MLKQRIITAVVLLAILLPALFYPSPFPFAAVTLVLIAAAAWEWGRLNGLAQTGALLEMTEGGRTPVTVNGQPRTFIEDGDTVALHGFAQGDGYRIGFGPCSGTILPPEE